MKNILLLSTFDSTLSGHALHLSKLWAELGENVFYLPLIRQYSNVDNFFIEARKHYSFRRILFAISLRISKLFVRDSCKEYCYFNLFLRGKKADQILKKVPFTPDLIVICWADGYISPKTIRDLYKLTQAEILITMIDAHILGGGCHYPCGCEQYQTGCKNCPALRIKWFAKKCFDERMKYLYDIPITIGGTKYDLLRSEKTPFLTRKKKIESVDYFVTSFVVEKKKARIQFEIPAEHFVIMFGAANINDKRKGMSFLQRAVDIMTVNKKSNRPITLLCLGNSFDKFSFKGFNVVTPGFLSYKEMITAFYASDIFVSPSIDDSGPYMVNYSIGCGRPVVSFPVGIALTHIRNKKIGYIAKWKDPFDLAKGILYYYEKEENYLRACEEECISLMTDYQNNVVPFYLQAIGR